MGLENPKQDTIHLTSVIQLKDFSNFSRAWQAYFLSYSLQILCESITFRDVNMMYNDDFDTSSGFRFGKISVSCSVHFYSLYLP